MLKEEEDLATMIHKYALYSVDLNWLEFEPLPSGSTWGVHSKEDFMKKADIVGRDVRGDLKFNFQASKCGTALRNDG